MLYRLIMGGGSIQSILLILVLTIPVLIISLSFHEFCHAWSAYLLGDPTAYYQGRMTINPIKHLDPFGTIAMLVFGFGWAKPVPIDTRYFKRPKLYMVIVSLAGPFSNLVLAFVSFPLMKLLSLIYTDNDILRNVIDVLIVVFYLMVIYNITLAIFNMLIIPPLDGSRIILALLPTNAYLTVIKYEKIIMIVLLVFLWTGLLNTPINFLRDGVMTLYDDIWKFVPFSWENYYNALSLLL